MRKAPTLLVILDGFGLSGGGTNDGRFDAVRAADTPCLDRFRRECSETALSASGQDVGLPEGQHGNPRAGCANIGAGRVVFQDLVRISRSIADGSFFRNPALLRAMDNCRRHGSALHLAGTLSDAGPESHIGHLFALLRMAKDHGVKTVRLHLFLEGRSPAVCRALLVRALEQCRELDTGSVATLMGRLCVTDPAGPDALEHAYDAMVYGSANVTQTDPLAVFENRKNNDMDTLEPVLCDPDGTISDNDSLIFWNFHPLCALARAFRDPEFDLFTRQLFPLECVCMTDYDVPGAETAFPPAAIPNTLGEYLSNLGLKQLRIAAKSGFQQVGFYFNGSVRSAFPGEDQVCVSMPVSGESPRNAPASPPPRSESGYVCEECVRRMESGVYDVIVLELPDCAQSGLTEHNAVRTVETVDACVGIVVEAALKLGGIAMVTASCGGAEALCPVSDSTKTGAVSIPCRPGSTNPVPFILCGAGSRLRSGGRLADIAPTLLDVMGLACPPEMDGKTLIVE